jgi:hypothetical protein
VITFRRVTVLRLRSETCYTRRRVYVYTLGLPTRYSSEVIIRYDVDDFRYCPLVIKASEL